MECLVARQGPRLLKESLWHMRVEWWSVRTCTASLCKDLAVVVIGDSFAILPGLSLLLLLDCPICRTIECACKGTKVDGCMLLDAILVMPESRLKPREGSVCQTGVAWLGIPQFPLAPCIQSEPMSVRQAA